MSDTELQQLAQQMGRLCRQARGHVNGTVRDAAEKAIQALSTIRDLDAIGSLTDTHRDALVCAIQSARSEMLAGLTE